MPVRLDRNQLAQRNQASTASTRPAAAPSPAPEGAVPSPQGWVAGRASLRTADVTTTPATARTGSLPLSKGATQLLDRATFEKLARREDVPGVLGAREVKFLITGVDGRSPQVYFVNTNNYVYHYDFATKALGQRMTLEEFNSKTYFRDDRKNLAGTIVAHDNFEGPRGKKGLYALEFWPTDPVGAKHVTTAFKTISKAMPFATGQLAYHPAGDTQEALFARDKAKLSSAGVKSIDTGTLFKNVTYSPLNPGEGYGVLRVVDGSQPDGRPPNLRDVVIFKTLPNDLSHVGGVISEAPQTPLSHINLKARQNDTPNAYVKDASTDPRIAPHLGKLVHYTVTPDGFTIEPATQAQADAWLEQVRPTRPQLPPRDLTKKKIVDLDDLGHADVKAFGAKAANLGELRNVLPRDQVPDGYAIPFSFYDSFMKANGFYDKAQRMMADPQFKADPAVRDRMLADFRRELRRAPVPADLAAQLTALQQKFPADQSIRCRSSTNNEDLEGFNGAGLYDSYTHRPDEGNLASTVKQTWASLWNFRAYEEREFHRIDHLTAAMGVAVHPNNDDEKANGVAVTKNIYDPNWPGFYINAQVGESLVTNPDPSATPDELLVSAIGPNREYETQYLRHSTLTRDGKSVLTRAQTQQLTQAMERIQEHFKRVYGKPPDDKQFAMDIEFKIDTAGKLLIKQARPWVE